MRDQPPSRETASAVAAGRVARDPGHVLVSMKTYLGDAVMAAPTLDALEEAGWKTTLLTAPIAAQALGRATVIPYERSRWPWQIAAQARFLRSCDFDACILINRSIRAALIARLARIPIRIGHPVEGRGPLLTHRVPYDPTRFEAASTAELVAPLRIEILDPVPRLRLTSDERAEGDRLRGGADLAIQPGARYDEKRLPLEALCDAARAWQAAGRRIVAVGGPEERTETDALVAAPNALILIPHDAAGPNLPTGDFLKAEWILWPEAQIDGVNNRILALATGLDLRGETGDAKFLNGENEDRIPQNGARLEARGVFEARSAYLGSTPTTVVRTRQAIAGTVSPSVLLIALKGPDAIVRTQGFDAPLPPEGLVLYEALGWDDARALSDRIGGRTLTVEYPPDGTDGWSRFWLRGSWPKGVPTESDVEVPGLVRARQALRLLLYPEAFTWHPDDVGRWGGANRWLIHGHEALPGMIAWFLSTAFVVAWAVAQVMNEDRGPFVSRLLVITALSPAALVLGGASAHAAGLEAWPVLLVLATGGLYGLSLLLELVVRRTLPETHPLWAPSVVGFATLVLFDPLWSDLSQRFGPLPTDVPPEALGALVAYLAGTVAFAPDRWLGRATVVAVVLWGVIDGPWWVGGHSALLLLPAVVGIAAEGLFRPALLGLFALLPTGVIAFARNGIAWNPLDLLRSGDEVRATNLWLHFSFLFSLLWVGTVSLFAMLGLLGNRFLAYRLGRLLRHDPRLRVLPWAVAGTLALGVTEPLCLPAVPVVAFGAMIALAYDGLRANS